MNNKKTNTDKKTIVFIIVIVFLVLLLVIESFGFLLYLVINNKNSNSDDKYTNTSWVNTYTLKGVKYETDLELKNGTFNYKTLKNKELDFTIDGIYKIVDDSIYLEYFNSEEDSVTTYSLKYNSSNDYLCFNHSSNCEEGYRFYRIGDERAFKYVELKEMYDEDIKEEEKKEEQAEVDTPQSENNVVPTMYVFYGKGCPHCEELFEWLETWNYDNEYKLVKYEVWYNDDNKAIMDAVAKHLNTKAEGVPFIVVGNSTMTGFTKYASPMQIKSMLDEAVKSSSEGTYVDVIETVSKK